MEEKSISKNTQGLSFKERCIRFVPYIVPVLLGLIIAIWCIAYISFFLWGVLSSFKDGTYFYHIDPIGFPSESYFWAPQNYSVVLEKMEYTISKTKEKVYLPTMLTNSLLYCIGNGVFSNLTMVFATYVLSKYKKNFSWVSILWTIYIITNYIPFSVDNASEIKLLNTLKIYDSMPGNWLYNCGAFGGGFLMMYGTWNAIPDTYMEAAEIDGANSMQILWHIMLPQVTGIVLVLMLTKISGMWDDYMPMIILLPSYPSVALGAFSIQWSVERGVTETTKIAALFLLSIPMIVMFFVMRSKIIKSMSMVGGIKG